MPRKIVRSKIVAERGESKRYIEPLQFTENVLCIAYVKGKSGACTLTHKGSGWALGSHDDLPFETREECEAFAKRLWRLFPRNRREVWKTSVDPQELIDSAPMRVKNICKERRGVIS